MRPEGNPRSPAALGDPILRSTAPEDTNATEASRGPHADLGDRRGLRPHHLLPLLASHATGGPIVLHCGISHSITSSASASTVWGISKPSAFAVLRLTTNSNLVGN
jgi:hypothetical protein